MKKTVIVGAGPAGLTAAWELVGMGFDVTVLERDPQYVGGLARTMEWEGFRFDIGAHRFYSKNSEISRWWRDRLPDDFIRIRRLTRVFYRGRFFHYPLKAGDALCGLGIITCMTCVLSYFWRRLYPVRPERSFEDWVINRFGDRLYRIFFKTYTEKVWGMRCSDINADWASQRIKGLSLGKAVLNALGGGDDQISAKTLMDEFDYPRRGAGMMWEKTRDEIVSKGGRLVMGRKITRFECRENRIVAACSESESGEKERWAADAFIVSMPLNECVEAMGGQLDETAQHAARQLAYRDFVLAVLIVNRSNLFPDNWIYIHSPEVKVGRIENFNNWGDGMGSKPSVTCLELEYFCSKGDAFWQMSNDEILHLAKRELEQLGLAKASEVLDGCVVRVEKAYPIYDSDYQKNVKDIRDALGKIENLQVIGRNGMHKYNNQDHSMLTGKLAAENLNGSCHDIWRINTDAEYLESESSDSGSGRTIPRPIT